MLHVKRWKPIVCWRLVCLLVLGSVALPGCADTLESAAGIYQEGGERAVSLTSRLLNLECARRLEKRQEFVNDVNAKQVERDKTARAVAQDCDGDGAPDF